MLGLNKWIHQITHWLGQVGTKLNVAHQDRGYDSFGDLGILYSKIEDRALFDLAK